MCALLDVLFIPYGEFAIWLLFNLFGVYATGNVLLYVLPTSSSEWLYT